MIQRPVVKEGPSLDEVDAHGTAADAIGLHSRFVGSPVVAGVNTRGDEVFVACAPENVEAATALVRAAPSIPVAFERRAVR